MLALSRRYSTGFNPRSRSSVSGCSEPLMQCIRMMFWLKWKLLFRGYRRSASEALGAILIVLVMAPVAVFIAVGLYFGFHNTDGLDRENLLRSALLGIYAFWIL